MDNNIRRLRDKLQVNSLELMDLNAFVIANSIYNIFTKDANGLGILREGIVYKSLVMEKLYAISEIAVIDKEKAFEYFTYLINIHRKPFSFNPNMSFKESSSFNTYFGDTLAKTYDENSEHVNVLNACLHLVYGK